MDNRYHLTTTVVICLLMALAPIGANAQLLETTPQKNVSTWNFCAEKISLLSDSIIFINPVTFPNVFFGPVVFEHYESNDTVYVLSDNSNKNAAFLWLEREIVMNKRMRHIKQKYMINNPSHVKYNMATLPKPPKQYHGMADPQKSSIEVKNIIVDKDSLANNVEPIEIKHRNWLYSFDGTLQFSQAYISPNWYQGGNNNLNMIANATYNINLNQAFYPNLLFETTVKYKLSLNSAPDDSLRSYSISEDLFQVNSKFGIPAIKNWYYSVQLQFKTQFFNSYKSNTHDMQAAFLSPGELNIGLGFTYNYAHPKGRFSLDASISPLSYNLKTCINNNMDETSYGIVEGRRTVNQIGSSGECKSTWNMTRNISLVSTFYLFSDYNYIQGDLENTLSFTINRYLSTQIYAHLRYDSSTARIDDSNWHKWQLKEILSFGFAYKLSNN